MADSLAETEKQQKTAQLARKEAHERERVEMGSRSRGEGIQPRTGGEGGDRGDEAGAQKAAVLNTTVLTLNLARLRRAAQGMQQATSAAEAGENARASKG